MRAAGAANWMYAEGFHEEDDATLAARARAEELGCTPVSPGVAAMLRVLAAASHAASVVEIGTGTGVSGLALLAGMGQDGVLTTIDIEPENQYAAREAFSEAGIRGNRVRSITGDALTVLDRLADGSYDMVFIDAAKEDVDGYFEQGMRLLRRGGTLILDNALWKGRVADPAQRDERTTSIRDLGRRVRDDDRLSSAMLAVGDGLLVAVKH